MRTEFIMLVGKVIEKYGLKFNEIMELSLNEFMRLIVEEKSK